MFFAVDDDGSDLLIEEDENGAENGGNDGERNQPVVRDVDRIDHPASATKRTLATSVAETSLTQTEIISKDRRTISGDSGLSRNHHYHIIR